MTSSPSSNVLPASAPMKGANRPLPQGTDATMFPILLVALTASSGIAPAQQTEASAQRPQAVEQVMVYHQRGRFGGWPANHGIWAWGDEILVGFSAGYHKDREPALHNIDHDRPEEHLLAR